LKPDARENNWCGSKRLEEIGKGELQPWLKSCAEKIAIANGTSNRPRENAKEIKRILTHRRNGRRTHMQSRIRNGRTRKKINSELVLANLELETREKLFVFSGEQQQNGRELNGDLYQGRNNG